MYRYLHGCRVTKGCGMLQVADPRPAPEESSSLPGPCTPDLNGFIVIKKKNKISGQSLHHYAMSKKLIGRFCSLLKPFLLCFFWFLFLIIKDE